MKPQLTKIALVLSLTVSFSTTSFANVIQTSTPASSDSYWNGNGWTWQELGSVTLAQGTNTISSLTSAVALKDQGWGGQDNSNGVLVSLFANGVDLYNIRVASATHVWTTQNYNITNNPSILNDLNVALDSVNWSTSPTVKLVMNATPFAYGGWELHTQNASFSVSSTVPESAYIAMLITGLLSFGASRKKNNQQNYQLAFAGKAAS